jgi:hypothetical protein
VAKKSRHRANGTRQAKRLSLSAHARRALMAKRTGRPLIPGAVLNALASMRLPKNKRVYNARLRELLGT